MKEIEIDKEICSLLAGSVDFQCRAWIVYLSCFSMLERVNITFKRLSFMTVEEVVLKSLPVSKYLSTL